MKQPTAPAPRPACAARAERYWRLLPHTRQTSTSPSPKMARELKDKSKDYNPIHHQQQFANLAQNLPLTPPSARSRSTATTVQPRDSTVSPLLNKRVRGVVDEANGLMHLRCTSRGHLQRTRIQCSAKHRHELWFTFNQSAYWEKKVEGKPAKHIMLG